MGRGSTLAQALKFAQRRGLAARNVAQLAELPSTAAQVNNIYQASGSVTHCVKYGKDVVNPAKNSDWWPAPDDFDAWTKSLDQVAIFAQLGLSEARIAELTGVQKAA